MHSGKSKSLILLITLAEMSFAQSFFSADPLMPTVIYDFGPAHSATAKGGVAVSETMYYSDSSGFGWSTRNGHGYVSEQRPLQNELTVDGVQSDSTIRFQTKIAPGRYWIRIVMGGGRFCSWKGQIGVNNHTFAADLKPYRLSTEDEEPPPYWAVIERATIKEPLLAIQITAQDQPSTLNAVQIFPDDPGSLVLEKGVLKANSALRTPNAGLILRLLNAGDVKEAQTLIEIIPEKQLRFEKALFLMALAGRLEVEQPRPLLEWSQRLLQEEQEHEYARVALNLHLLENYLQADSYYKMAGWDWARAYSEAGIFLRQDAAGRLWDEIGCCEEHPLHSRVLWEVGKLAFKGWVEDHSPWLLQRAHDCFAQLKKYYPDHAGLRVYSGEKICPPKVVHNLNSDIPIWVQETLQAKENVQNLLHYWVNTRQSDAGEFGGKYDDDVEMLRWWPLARLAMEDSLALLGFQRLVNGIWNSYWIEKGFSRKVRDVEHSSEPVADTQPIMIGLDYGNPIYVERCMESAKGVRDLWTGINSKGHRHFKTSWYSATQLDERPPRDCDVPMNTRTVQAVRWLAWYNHHPFALQFIREWADAWLADCRRTDRGKPYGIVPAAIRYHDDAIGGHGANWYEPGLFWKYYDFSGGHLMLQQFLAAYDLLGDAKYLEPVETAIRLLAKYGTQDLEASPAGGEAWVVNKLRKAKSTGEVFHIWRMLSGHNDYDHLLQQFGSEYDKFLLSRNPSYLEETSRSMTEALCCQGELLTREGYFTDRIEIADLHSGKNWDTAHLEAIYTGASLNEAFYPFYAVTWKKLDRRCLPVVLHASSEQVELLVWNSSMESQSAEAQFWRLSPGQYECVQGLDKDNDWQMDNRKMTQTLTIQERPSSCRMVLPGRSATIVRVEQSKGTTKSLNWTRPDLALAREEIKAALNPVTGDVEFTVPVHNIGNREARSISVEMVTGNGKNERILAPKKIPVLEAPLDLDPRVAVVVLKTPAVLVAGKSVTIAVDAQNRIDEINEANNSIVMTLAGTGN
jgi:hypothetical protein